MLPVAHATPERDRALYPCPVTSVNTFTPPLVFMYATCNTAWGYTGLPSSIARRERSGDVMSDAKLPQRAQWAWLAVNFEILTMAASLSSARVTIAPIELELHRSS